MILLEAITVVAIAELVRRVWIGSLTRGYSRFVGLSPSSIRANKIYVFKFISALSIKMRTGKKMRIRNFLKGRGSLKLKQDKATTENGRSDRMYTALEEIQLKNVSCVLA